MAETNEKMECAKDEDAVAVAVSATDAVVDSPKTDDNPSKSVTAPETKAVNDEPAVVCETADVPTKTVDVPTKTVVADDNKDYGNPATNEDNELNVAMASTTLSDLDEVKESQVVSDKQLVQDTSSIENENSIVDNAVANPDVVPEKTFKSDEEPNSVVDGEFEDAHEYIDGEANYCVEKEQECGEELLNDGEDLKDEADEPITELVVPVPVDDDTNDPQYIPRRGRFYEHDDRMAYSTTSSEGSESDSSYEQGSGDSSAPNRIRRRHTSSKKSKATTVDNMAENTTIAAADVTTSKRVLAISKVAATQKVSSETSITSADGSVKKLGRKSRNIDSLDRWTHDMYDEREQTRKTRDELLASYGYDILEESEAPRARRHHKYGRAATAKYTRSWQDTKAYTGVGQQTPKGKRGLQSPGGLNKNKNKSKTSDEYTTEFPALDKAKSSDPKDDSTIESSTTIETSSSNQSQPLKTLAADQEKKTAVSTVTDPSRHQTTSPRATKYGNSSANRNYHQEQLNGNSPSSSTSSHNKNFFNRPSADYPTERENNAQVNQDNPTMGSDSNYFNRRPQQQHSGSHVQNHNFKQHYNNSPGGHGNKQHHQYSQSSAPRGRNFHQNHNNQQQYNRDRYFAKGSGPTSLVNNSNQQHYDQHHHHNVTHTTAGTGRTQHSGGHFHHYNNQHYENDNQQIEQPASRPVVRSSKRYSVQSRRELPDPVLNFNSMSKTSQSQTHNQQQNGLVIQEQQQVIQQIPQQQISQQQLSQQQISQQISQQQISQQQISQQQISQQQISQQQISQQQIPQQGPPPIQMQQYHPPLQQIHHGMVLDHTTGMMVMASADPSMYHHQLFTPPQYATTVPPNSAPGGADDPNAAAAAAALQMLAAQAAVYQPVPTGATGITPTPAGAQTLHQPSETFMTTYYQPQLQHQKQPPPRRVNLAIPIVAPPPENNSHQGIPKTNPSPTPTAASTN